MRIEEILQNRANANGETWKVIEDDSTFMVKTERLGTHVFDTEDEKDSFIEANHRGAPKNGVGIIHRTIVD